MAHAGQQPRSQDLSSLCPDHGNEVGRKVLPFATAHTFRAYQDSDLSYTVLTNTVFFFFFGGGGGEGAWLMIYEGKADLSKGCWDPPTSPPSPPPPKKKKKKLDVTTHLAIEFRFGKKMPYIAPAFVF